MRKCSDAGQQKKADLLVLEAIACAHIHICFAGTFRVELERGRVSGKTVALELMVLILEVTEFQVPRGVVQKLRTKFIDGL